MTTDENSNIASLELGQQLDKWQEVAKKMSRRELEEAIFIELKAIQSELRVILDQKRPKNS